jgi:hypothetical protein
MTSRIRNLDDGGEHTVRSKYVIGYDEGRRTDPRGEDRNRLTYQGRRQAGRLLT